MSMEKVNPGTLAGVTEVRVSAELEASKTNHTPYTRSGKAALVTFEGLDGLVRMILKGRELWALRELIRVGANGVAPIERPAPRWSHYIFQLRAHGLSIETIREEHGGEYPGHHGRYVLRTPVAIGCGA
jgi:hypothetical protein